MSTDFFSYLLDSLCRNSFRSGKGQFKPDLAGENAIYSAINKSYVQQVILFNTFNIFPAFLTYLSTFIPQILRFLAKILLSARESKKVGTGKRKFPVSDHAQ